jgi:hypothetical protein
MFDLPFRIKLLDIGVVAVTNGTENGRRRFI